jgi:hypothetical protein
MAVTSPFQMVANRQNDRSVLIYGDKIDDFCLLDCHSLKFFFDPARLPSTHVAARRIPILFGEARIGVGSWIIEAF